MEPILGPAISLLATPLVSIVAAYGFEEKPPKVDIVEQQMRGSRDRSPTQATASWAPVLLGKHAAEGVFIPSGVELLAFPTGVKIETFAAPPPNVHHFVLTLRDGSCTYGHCITKYEIVPADKNKDLAQRRYGPTSPEATVPKLFNSLDIRALTRYKLLFHLDFPSLLRITQFHTRVVENQGTLRIGNVAVPYLVPADAALVDVDPYPLFKRLDPTAIISLFSALLCERSIIFVCNDFYTITAIISTFISLMSPLYWPHAFIPILPSTLRVADIFSVGIPFLLGLNKKAYESAKAAVPAHVIVVDVETSHITFRSPIQLLPVRLELRLLSEISKYAAVYSYHNPGVSYALPDNFPMQSHPGGMKIERVEDIKGIKDISKISFGGLVKGIATGETQVAEVVTPRTLQTLNSSDSEGGSDIDQSSQLPLSDIHDPSPTAPRINLKAVQRAFESVLVSLLKRYYHFLLPAAGGDQRMFNSQAFLAEVPPDCADVLSMLVKTELFSCFIQDALLNPAPTDFDRKIMLRERKHLAAIQSFAAQPVQAEMWKRGHETKNWKKRLFKLEKDLLSYYEPPKPAARASSGARPASTGRDEKVEAKVPELVLKGSISIAIGKTLVTVPRESAKTKYPTRYPFVVRTSNHELEICAEDSSTRRRFIKAIKARIHRTESLHKPAIDEATKSSLKQKRVTLHTKSVLVSFDSQPTQPPAHP